MKQSRIFRLVEWLARLCSGAAFIGLCIDFTVRDRYPIASTLYYALPESVGAGLLFCAATFWFWLGRRTLALVSILSAFSMLGFWLHVTWHPAQTLCSQTGTKLLFWNVNRLNGGWDSLTADILQYDSDIIALVEAGPRRPLPESEWQNKFPNYHRYLPGDRIALLTKEPIIETNFYRLNAHNRLATARTTVNNKSFLVWVLDLDSDPFESRETTFAEVDALLDKLDFPSLIVGDFNTPIGSVWFEKMRKRFKNAFEEAGTGLFASWPEPLPVLAIDHVWLAPSVGANCAQFDSTTLSDHRRVRAWLRVTP